MAVDPLKVAQDIQMQRRRFDALAQSVTQPLVMAFGCLPFSIAEIDFLRKQPTRQIAITADEDIHGELQVLFHPAM